MNYIDLKFRLGNFLAQYPTLYYSVAGLLFKEKSGQKRVDESVSVIIDGYPRSANTFSYWAFLHAQPEGFDAKSVAHHIHKSAQIIRGIELGKPVLLLIRKPEDCVASLLIRQPQYTAESAVLAYCWFYEALVPHKDAVVVADFDDVTHRYGAVIEALNKRYGTRFAPFVHTEENMKQVYDLIGKAPDSLKHKVSAESRVAMPSKGRKDEKAKIEAQLREDPKVQRLLERANKVYQSFVTKQGKA
jgi:hypothetical protein